MLPYPFSVIDAVEGLVCPRPSIKVGLFGDGMMGKRNAWIFAMGLTFLGASPAIGETFDMQVDPTPIGSNPAIETVATSTWSGAASASAAAAQEGPGSTSDSGWEFAATPYLWMSGMKTEISTPQGEEIDIDQSFSDILGDLKFAFMGTFEAKRGRFVTVHDLIYLSIGTSAEGSLGPGIVEADADVRLLTSAHLLGYRLVDQGPLFLDLLAGARITSLAVDVDLTGPLQSRERDSSTTKISPVMAARFRAPLGERWGFALYGDLGGFGVTSDLSWQLMGTVQYDFSDQWRVAAGWRHFAANKKKGDFDVDLALDGPIMGFTYRF